MWQESVSKPVNKVGASFALAVAALTAITSGVCANELIQDRPDLVSEVSSSDTTQPAQLDLAKKQADRIYAAVPADAVLRREPVTVNPAAFLDAPDDVVVSANGALPTPRQFVPLSPFPGHAGRGVAGLRAR
jgi:hypothetical protein